MQSLQNAYRLVRWNFDKLVTFAKEKAIDLAIVGMDDPLVGGLIDEFEKPGSAHSDQEKMQSNPGGKQGIFKRSDEKI